MSRRNRLSNACHRARLIPAFEAIGARPVAIDAAAKTVYHAASVFASNYLVTLHRVASELFHSAAAPPAALRPLMQRTIENGERAKRQMV